MRQRGRMPHPRPLPESLAGRPFTVSDALAIGVGRDRLDRSDLTAPFMGVRAPAALVIDPLTRVRLGLLGCGEHAFSSGASAATVIGIPLPSRYLGATVVEIAVPAPGRAIRRRGVSGRVLRVSDGEVVHWLGVRVTDPARTWCDLAIVLSVPELVAAGDWLLRHGLSTAGSLAAAERARADRRGAGRIRVALPMLDPRSESPKESELRALIVLAGMPRPSANVEIHGPDRRLVARVDLLFEEYGEVLEYHGDHHRTDVRQWRRDRTREADLESLGYHVMEVTDDDLARPRSLTDRIERNLRRRGWSP